MPPRDLEALVAQGKADLAKYEAALDRAGQVTEKRAAQLTGAKTETNLKTIKAEFDGAERQFGVDRQYFPILEGSLGRSAYATLKSFTGGQWTFNDVALVLSFALHGPTPADRSRYRMAIDATRFGMPFVGVGYAAHPDVVKVLTRDGHGTYADLAAEILADAIFGETEDDGYGGEVDAAA